MILKSLSIRRRFVGYGDEPSPETLFEGSVEFEGRYGSVSCNLNGDTSRAVLAVVADSLVESSKDLADNLTAEIFNGAALAGDDPKLEAPLGGRVGSQVDGDS